EEAADHLFVLVNAIKRRLNSPDLPVAFAGGLLTSANPLSLRLCELLQLSDIPQPRYPPVIGAALLAALTN
ncbi:MAG: N-acetylglucosamine kinase, partial [Anaerolinea sp.]|nr:N-acetylglucosamine kinase [Anaerolinea sp.]